MKKDIYLKVIIIALLIGNILVIVPFLKPHEEKSDYCFYGEDEKYVLIEKNTLSNDITSLLYKDNEDNYLGKIYQNNEEIKIEDLIKEDKINLFKEKINHLLSLKYPKFIVDVLIKEETLKSYLLRDNELVIYYSNYDINPEVEEVLYLVVNYNEIKDYLVFSVVLDSDYQVESGYNYTKSKKAVALSIDDSPNRNKTDKIVTFLKDNMAHATFFVVGEYALGNEDLLRLIKDNGNEIGSHTFNHANLKKLSKEEIQNDFQKMNNIYKGLFQEDLKLLRPPYGSINSEITNYLDVSFILWSLDTNDWRYRDSDYLVNYVIDNIKDGDIILFHDSYDSTVKALEELLPLLYSKGYQVMSVQELFALKGQTLEAHKIYYQAK